MGTKSNIKLNGKSNRHEVTRLSPADRRGLLSNARGLELTSVLQGDVDVSHFAAIELMKTDKGRAHLRTYYAPYIDIARDAGAGFILEVPTWRANTD